MGFGAITGNKLTDQIIEMYNQGAKGKLDEILRETANQINTLEEPHKFRHLLVENWDGLRLSLLREMLTTNDMTHLLQTGIKAIMFQAYDDVETVYDKIGAILVETNSRNEKFAVTSSVGSLELRKEGDAFIEDKVSSYYLSLTNSIYSKGISITEQMLKYDQSGTLKLKAIQIGRGMKQFYDQRVAELFNNGWNSSDYAIYDGLEMFSLTHPYEFDGSETFSNEHSTSSSTITFDTVNTAIGQIIKWKDDQELNARVRPKILIVPPALEYKAHSILKQRQLPTDAEASDEGLADYIRGNIKDYITWGDLSSETAWFIQTSLYPSIIIITSQKPTLFQEEAYAGESFTRGIRRFKAEAEAGAAFTNARAFWGCPGV